MPWLGRKEGEHGWVGSGVLQPAELMLGLGLCRALCFLLTHPRLGGRRVSRCFRQRSSRSGLGGGLDEMSLGWDPGVSRVSGQVVLAVYAMELAVNRK